MEDLRASDYPAGMLPDARPAQVWLVEDNDLYRQTVSALLSQRADIECPVAAASCEELFDALDAAECPDVVLMDIGLPGMSGIEGCRRVRERIPDARVLMLTVHDERDTVFEAIQVGASGYLLKGAEPEELMAAIDQVVAGGAPINAFIARKLIDAFAGFEQRGTDYGLTPRESEILALMVEGLTMRNIAERLRVSYHTVDSHVRNIYDKLHVHTRGGAVAKALKERLV